jgi:hypothetical protein
MTMRSARPHVGTHSALNVNARAWAKITGQEIRRENGIGCQTHLQFDGALDNILADFSQRQSCEQT